MSIDENSCSFLLVPAPKMMTATSTEQSTESSWAFLKRPPFRFRKVLGAEHTVSWGRERSVRGGESLHGAVPVILDGLDLDLPATHCDGGRGAAAPTMSMSRLYLVDSRCGLPPTEMKHQQPTVSVVKLVACVVVPGQRGAPEQCAALV